MPDSLSQMRHSPPGVSAFDLETRCLTISLSPDQLRRCPPEASRPPVSQQYAVKIAGPPPAALHWADSRPEIDAVDQHPSLESVRTILGHIVVGWDVRNVRVADVRLHTPGDLFRPQLVAFVVRRFWNWRCSEDIPAESVIELGTDHGSVFIEIAHPTAGKARSSRPSHNHALLLQPPSLLLCSVPPRSIRGPIVGKSQMTRRRKTTRFLVWILVCCSHMPFPCMDCDEPRVVANETTENDVDIDFVLLGADFPDDVDDGPLDDDPEQSHSSFGDYFLPAKRCSSDAVSEAEFASASLSVRNLATQSSSQAACLHLTTRPRQHSFGGTFIVSSVQEWREHLAVFLI